MGRAKRKQQLLTVQKKRQFVGCEWLEQMLWDLDM
jgi:hypothetical protein